MSRRAVASRLLIQGQACWRSLSTSSAAEISGRPGEIIPPVSSTHQDAFSGKMVVRICYPIADLPVCTAFCGACHTEARRPAWLLHTFVTPPPPPSHLIDAPIAGP